MTELDRTTFAKGVNDAIKALRAVYGGVRLMFDDLRNALESEPAPVLKDIRIRVFPRVGRGNADEKTLRSWMGRLYTDPDLVGGHEEDGGEEDADESGASGRTLVLRRGQNLAFAKVELFRTGELASEPHVVYGVLRDCRVEANWPITEIEIKSGMFGRLLEHVTEKSEPGPLKTDATLRRPASVAQSSSVRRSHVMFTLDTAPHRVALFDVRSHEDVQKMAAELKASWACFPPA